LKQKKPSLSEHLASLSVQYNVYPAELFQALVSARENKVAVLEDLTVEYRGSVDKEAIFLIKNKGNVLVQFRVPEETLEAKAPVFDNWMESDRVRRQIAKQTPKESVSTAVRDLRHGMKKVNVEATVQETEEPRMVHTQFGTSVMMSNASITDETGKIKLCLWDTQVNSVEPGDVIQIKNASVATFKGERQLRLGKNGTLTIISGKSKSKKTIVGEANADKVVCA
jgi:replication factor A1